MARPYISKPVVDLDSIAGADGADRPQSAAEPLRRQGDGPLVQPRHSGTDPSTDKRPLGTGSAGAPLDPVPLDPTLEERRRVTSQLLARLRARLLDLDNSNGLLDLRSAERARAHVHVVDASPDALFRSLAAGRTLTFEAHPETADEDAEEAGAESSTSAMPSPRDETRRQGVTALIGQAVPPRIGVPDEPGPPTAIGAGRRHRRDGTLQVPLSRTALERALFRIHNGARLALSETARNVLHVAFGFLEWYEDETSREAMHAPLLFYPAEMERRLLGRAYRYGIRATGDDGETNIALAERLKRDFGIELPALDHDDTPEAYCAKVEEIIAGRSRWRVRRSVSVGLFDFGRAAMYRDLDPERWPAVRPLAYHSVLTALLGGADGQDASDTVETAPPHPAEGTANAPFLVVDADDAQTAAIADAMSGRNLVVQGPPGTGKSQTIANMIATALAKGDRVLFVSNKEAALRTVKGRLDEAGLGPFVLELHSAQARRSEALSAIAERLKVAEGLSPPAPDGAIAEEARAREQLTRYAEVINQRFGESGKTLHALFWAGVRARATAEALALPAALDAIDLEGVEGLGPSGIARRREILADLSAKARDFTERFGAHAAHPWAMLGRSELSPFEQQELLSAIEAWHASLEALRATATEGIETHGLPLSGRPLRELAQLAMALRLPTHDLSQVFAAALPALADGSAREALEQFAQRLSTLDRLEVAIREQLDYSDEPPAAAAIREIEAGTRTLDDSRPFKGTVAELAAFAAAHRTLAERLRELAEAAHALLAAAKLSGPAWLSRIKILADAASLVAETPRKTLVRRSPALFNEAVAPALEDAAEHAEMIRARRTALSEHFVLNEEADPEDLRARATALRMAGLFGRLFGKSYKRARAVWTGCVKEPGKAKPDAMAADLETLAEHVASVQSLVADSRLAAICGPQFAGAETDFRGLRAANEFACTVENRFAGTASTEARRLLLEADTATLDSFVAAAPRLSSALTVAITAAESIGSTLSDNTDLNGLAAASDKTAELAESLHAALVDAGFHADAHVSELGRIARALDEREAELCAIAEHATARTILRADFDGRETSRDGLAATLAFARDLAEAGLADDLLRALLRPETAQNAAALADFGSRLQARLEEAGQRGNAAIALGGFDERQLANGRAIEDADPAALAERLGAMLAARAELAGWVAFNQGRDEAAELGLGKLLAACEAAGGSVHALPAAFDHVYHRAIVQAAYERYPELALCSGANQEETLRRFRSLDRRIMAFGRERLRTELARVRVDWGRNTGAKSKWTGLHLIQDELGKEGRRGSLRDLFVRAGQSIQQLKPCWMMSPAAIAQLLDPDGVRFDLVVIDEASQMRLEEALGAIARGAQLVVVGDPKQLPPKPLRAMPDAVDGVTEAETGESILDRARSVFQPARRLRRHYRSRHESLIAFSNRQFYDGDLIVAPSPHAANADFGIEYVHVADGRYAPEDRVNVPEARALATAACEHMSRSPFRSLGLVTLSEAQCDLLAEEMDRLFASHPLAQRYRDHWAGTPEPFFVKSVDHVQGDERDAIMISTVYGRAEPGEAIPQRFGAIDGAAGLQRLNVLVTRAREKIVVVTSMEPDDLAPEIGAKGAPLLKAYLDAAKTGGPAPALDSGPAPDSDFEIFIVERLAQHGYAVVPRLGTGACFVDLAVRHPRDEARYLCALVGDGAAYEAAGSPRERDRGRPETLERLGWHVYRIWLTDWVADPEGEARRLVAHLNALAAC